MAATRMMLTFSASPALRRIAVPAYRAYAEMWIGYPPPRVLANGIPKAGTHLLGTLLRLLPQMRFSGRHEGLGAYRSTPFLTWSYTDDDVDWHRLTRSLRHVRHGQYVTGHIPFTSAMGGVLERLGYRHLVMLRDPRDIIVSDAIYMTRTRRHRHHARFSRFGDVDTAIMAAITGFGTDEAGPGLESISERLANYLPWLDDDRVLVCRFEQLIGERGGGDAELQRDAVRVIAEHVGRPLAPAALDRVCAGVWSPGSSTFRKGMVGEWRRYLTPEHLGALADVTGPQLAALGYPEGGGAG